MSKNPIFDIIKEEFNICLNEGARLPESLTIHLDEMSYIALIASGLLSDKKKRIEITATCLLFEFSGHRMMVVPDGPPEAFFH